MPARSRRTLRHLGIGKNHVGTAALGCPAAQAHRAAALRCFIFLNVADFTFEFVPELTLAAGLRGGWTDSLRSDTSAPPEQPGAAVPT